MEKQTKRQSTFTPISRFYAQPYDISAVGFFFEGTDDYRAKADACRNAYGQPVKEFEIQFIDGNDLDAALFEALSVSQATILAFIAKLDEWDDHHKIRLIIAVGEGGYSFDFDVDEPDDFDVDIYEDMRLTDLAYQFVDEGLFGDVPERLSFYIDYNAIARDLGADYTEITIAGTEYVYRLG